MMQATHALPNADAVVQRHLHAAGTSIIEETSLSNIETQLR
jgi:hypothetical protein